MGYLRVANGMGAVVNVEMIVAVELEEIEAHHEALENRMRLECDYAVEIALVLRPQKCSVDFPVDLLKEVVFAK